MLYLEEMLARSRHETLQEAANLASARVVELEVEDAPRRIEADLEQTGAARRMIVDEVAHARAAEVRGREAGRLPAVGRARDPPSGRRGRRFDDCHGDALGAQPMQRTPKQLTSGLGNLALGHRGDDARCLRKLAPRLEELLGGRLVLRENPAQDAGRVGGRKQVE